MRPDLPVKLLELTKKGRRLDLGEMSEQMHIDESTLVAEIASLNRAGLVSSDNRTVEQNTRQRMALAEHLIRIGRDPQKISRCLEWQEFEDFATQSVEENGFQAIKHLVFKSRLGRREIDLLAWNDNFLLAFDCKHWLRGLSGTRLQKAAQAQVERAVALAERPDILLRRGVRYAEKRTIMPVIFALGDPRERIVDGVPVVSVSKLMSFLYGVSPLDEKLRIIPVKASSTQSVLM